MLEPAAVFKPNWHIDAVCDHLTAVTSGEINRLLINVPPGTMKSLLASVMWQAWEWGPMGRPSTRYLSTSFNDGPVTRDTRKTRDLIWSEWYQALWPEVKLIRVGETSFANSKTGTREGVAFRSLTSQRGDRLTIDDPHSTESAESDTDRATTTRMFREGAQNRLNDQKKSAIVCIMQRLHPNDVSGVIEQYRMNYCRLMLPMEYDPKRAFVNGIGFRDPRQQDGELLDPVRFPQDVLDKLKNDLGPHAYAGQYQQRPSNREGGMFKRHWFKIVDAVPAEAKRAVRRWDLAASLPKPGSDPDWTAGVKMLTDGRRYYISDVAHFRESALAVRAAIRNHACMDGAACKIVVPQDPGQAGKDQAESIIAENVGFNIRAVRETGDKGTRAEPLAAQMEAGNVYLLRAAWNEKFIDELCSFPIGHDDMLDASAGALNELAGTPAPLNITADVLKASMQRSGAQH